MINGGVSQPPSQLTDRNLHARTLHLALKNESQRLQVLDQIQLLLLAQVRT